MNWSLKPNFKRVVIVSLLSRCFYDITAIETAAGAQQSIELDVGMSMNEFKKGNNVEISISVRNLSDSLLPIKMEESRTHGERDFYISVRRNGVPLPPNSYGSKIYTDRGVEAEGIYRAHSLAPSRQYVETANINSVYDLSETGAYTVCVFYRPLTKSSPGYVRSNSINFQITGG